MTGGTRVFLDASVLIAAAASPTGGSSAALALLTGSDVFQVAVSPQVLREALVNLRAKFDRSVLARFYALLGGLHAELLEPSVALGIEIPASVPTKDHHVLQACVAGRVAICLTLDRRHLLTEAMRRWALPRGFRLLTPGEFLEWQRAQGAQGPRPHGTAHLEPQGAV